MSLQKQIVLMRVHRDVLVSLLKRGRDTSSLTQDEVEALEHAIMSYTEGADMLERQAPSVESFELVGIESPDGHEPN